MEKSSSKSKSLVGFLTVIEHPQHGLFGGYLILQILPEGRSNFIARRAVKANRAQQILYGPTLDSFLYGEQIGATLLGHAKSSPLAICTDREPVLALGDLTDLPVALVLPPDEIRDDKKESPTIAETKTGTVPILRLDAAHRQGPRLLTFELGRNRLALAHVDEKARQELTERLSGAAESLDLWEPFTRIREAIEEAQQAAR